MLTGCGADLRDAHATLARGTAFLIRWARVAGAGSTMRPWAITGPHRARVIGNSLRELDRFLNLLVDHACASIAPAHADTKAFGRQHNTANKLRSVRTAMALHSPDHERLRAIGRLRECLFHCDGVLHRPNQRNDLLLAAKLQRPGRNSARFRPGERLAITADDVERICLFYDDVGADLVEACHDHLQSR